MLIYTSGGTEYGLHTTYYILQPEFFFAISLSARKTYKQDTERRGLYVSYPLSPLMMLVLHWVNDAQLSYATYVHTTTRKLGGKSYYSNIHDSMV